MQRFYSDTPLPIDLTIDCMDQVHQMTRVLRLKEWDEVIFFDGDGSETLYEIIQIEKKRIFLRGKDRYFPEGREPRRNITLYQALPNKHEKIEWIIQKAVEVGIRRIVFFRSDRSQKLMLSDAKKRRYQLIAREALEQCGGLVPLEIEWHDTLSDPLLQRPGKHHVLHTAAQSSRFGDIVWDQIHLWVGPEGGWSEGEIMKMGDYGFIINQFSQRILRTETAGIVVAYGLIHG